MESNIFDIIGMIRDITFIVCLPIICVCLFLTIKKINRLLNSLTKNSENMENITDSFADTFSGGKGALNTLMKLVSIATGITRIRNHKGDD